MPKKKVKKQEEKESVRVKKIKAVFSKERIFGEKSPEAVDLYNKSRYGEYVEDKVQYSLVEALHDSDLEVWSGDIQTGENFFDYTPPYGWDCLVTNPPFSIKYKWIARCYELSKPFALLLPVETLGAKTAQKYFRDYGVQVIFIDGRVNFKMPNMGWDGAGAQFPTAWFTFGLDLPQDMIFSGGD